MLQIRSTLGSCAFALEHDTPGVLFVPSLASSATHLASLKAIVALTMLGYMAL